MAIFDRESDNKKSYVALLDENGELAAFIQPVKGINNQLIASALAEKGVKVEIRDPKPELTTLKL